MAENVQYTGRLGLDSRDGGALAAAVSVVVDALDDFGHPAEAIQARAENTARLQCDAYFATLRLRRVPLRRASRLASHIMQPAALLELTLTPVYAEHCDAEICELLLAEMLRRLIAAVEATSVEWQQAEVALSCEQFLSVFEAPPARTSASAAAPCVRTAERCGETGRAGQQQARGAETASAPLDPSASPRPRGRACFSPIEQTAPALEAHCERAFRAAGLRRAASGTQQAAQRARARMQRSGMTAPRSTMPGPRPAARKRQAGGLAGRLTAPFQRGFLGRLPGGSGAGLANGWAIAAALGLGDLQRMRFVGHLLLVSALVLFLDSAGTVHAARPLLP